MTDQTVLQDISNPKGEDPTRSLLNLIELGTFDLDLAAWCVSRVSRGASWITGSGPGGIGKTSGGDDFDQLIDDVDNRLFRRLPDATLILPGHGDNTTLGSERPHLPAWRERRW